LHWWDERDIAEKGIGLSDTTTKTEGGKFVQKKQPLVYQDKVIPFILLIICFAAWGVAANMTDPLVKVFSKIFNMSTLQGALVQFSYYGAYFCLALPAAFINRRYSYKVGVLTGLGLAAVGAFMFYPASQLMVYGYFLAALFILAAGLSILETSANPFVIAMGPEGNATRRLNLAQAFNPVGTNLGVLLATALILPKLNAATSEERTAMSAEQLRSVQAAELDAVMTPYVGMAFVLVAIWVAIALVRMPTAREASAEGPREVHFTATLGRLMSNPHYRYLPVRDDVADGVCAADRFADHGVGAGLGALRLHDRKA
jgi:FHS family L-fucose permease-like MFS transporter